MPAFHIARPSLRDGRRPTRTEPFAASAVLTATSPFLLCSAMQATSAAAFTIRATEFSGCVDPQALGLESCIGSELTIGFRVEEDPGDENIRGLGISIDSYGANELVSGQAVSSYLHTFADPAVGAFGGFDNLVGPSLSENSIAGFGNRVQVLLSASIVGRPVLTDPPPPGSDPGLDGVIGGGDAMIRVTFALREAAIWRIGTDYFGDGLILSDGSTQGIPALLIEVSGESPPVVLTPEPTTSVLVGLGLMALGKRRPRSY